MVTWNDLFNFVLVMAAIVGVTLEIIQITGRTKK